MLVSAVISTCLLAVAAVAIDTGERKLVPGAYIFEFEDGDDHAAFDSMLKTRGKSRRKFESKLFRGVSVQLHDLDHAEENSVKMASSRGVKNVWPVETYELPRMETLWAGNPPRTANFLFRRDDSSNNSYSPHVMTQIDRLHAEGYKGKGVKIAVIDSGVDYNHPALGGCFGKGCVITGGYDLVGDDYTGSGGEPIPDDDPMDCYGHGTHTIGILAAQEGNALGIIGAAPEAEFWAYKVYGCGSGAESDIYMAAIYQAHDDGADVISMSISHPGGWSDHPLGRAASDVVSQGTSCVFSAGNTGYDGMWKASSTYAGRGVTAAGSVENTLIPTVQYISSYTVGDGKEADFSYTPGYPPGRRAWDDIQMPLWLADKSICESAPEDIPDLSGQIVLIQRSNCPLEIVASTLFRAGGEYFIVASDGDDAPTVYLDLIVEQGIKAAASVVSDVGSRWIETLESGLDVRISMKGPEKADSVLVSLPNRQTGGAMSVFSSQGPTWDLEEVKPSFAAPGGWILSLLPERQGGYSVQSGTSCSAPLVAGAYALVSQVRGTTDPATLQRLLATTSDPVNFHDGTESFDYLAPVPQQGGGIIRAYDAAYAMSLLSTSQLSFGDSRTRKKNLNFTVVNESDEEITYEIGNVPTVSVYTFNESSLYPYQAFPNKMVDKHASLSFSETKFTLPPGDSFTIDVTANDESIGPDRLPVWSGWVIVNGTDGTALSIPYYGVIGSLYEQTVLPQNGAWISASDKGSFGAVPDDTKFILPRPNSKNHSDIVFPMIMPFLALGTTTLRADIVPLDKSHGLDTKDFFGNKTIGQPASFPKRYLPRGEVLDRSANEWEWNGMLSTGEFVPEGRYRIVLRALRIYGDPEREDDWDVAEAGTLRIQYAQI